MKSFLRKIWGGWKKVAHAIGVFQTKLILTILYFVVIGLASLMVRLFRRDLLDRRVDDRSTLWRDRIQPAVDLNGAKRQF